MDESVREGKLRTARGLRPIAALFVALIAVGIAGCAGEVDSVERARAQVAAKEDAVADAEAELTEASELFCSASQTYVVALDRYGDVLHESAPTVGDVREAGADLAEPQADALDGAEAAVQAQQDLTVAQQELTEARAALAQAEAGASGTPSVSAIAPPTPTPAAPQASIDRVTLAEAEFAEAQGAITDQTPLAEASELFNSAAVALELAWLRLFVDAGCTSEEQTVQAESAVAAYTTALQQSLAEIGYYQGAIDGVYGPQTVAAVEELQSASGLPVTGTVDQATAVALQAALAALGGAAAQDAVAATAAVQQTLKLLGFWDGPVDGEWTEALTEAVKACQEALGVEPTGSVDAATVSALQRALAELAQPEPSPTPSPTPSA